MDASTGGGNVEIGPVAGSVRAGTGAGDIHVTLADAGSERQTVNLTLGGSCRPAGGPKQAGDRSPSARDGPEELGDGQRTLTTARRQFATGQRNLTTARRNFELAQRKEQTPQPTSSWLSQSSDGPS